MQMRSKVVALRLEAARRLVMSQFVGPLLPEGSLQSQRLATLSFARLPQVSHEQQLPACSGRGMPPPQNAASCLHLLQAESVINSRTWVCARTAGSGDVASSDGWRRLRGGPSRQSPVRSCGPAVWERHPRASLDLCS